MDRNNDILLLALSRLLSLSARRAWIEMIEEVSKYVVKDVALRKESVERNKNSPICVLNRLLSLSARRAWIEIILSR